MRSNFREGMRRLCIVVSVFGSVIGGICGYLLVTDSYALTANRFLQESVLVEDCIVALLLPTLGFLVPWEVIHLFVWIWSGLSGLLTPRGQEHSRHPARVQRVPGKIPELQRERSTAGSKKERQNRESEATLSEIKPTFTYILRAFY